MLSEEACLMGRYGENGVDWDFSKDGDISIYGTPATIEIKNQIWNTLQNKHLMQIVPYISRPKFSQGVTWDGNTTDGEYMNAQAALLYQPYEPEEYISYLPYLPEEEASISEIRASIDTQVLDSIKDFVTGKWDIYDDTVWAEYCNEYTQLGLEEFIFTSQMAYARTH